MSIVGDVNQYLYQPILLPKNSYPLQEEADKATEEAMKAIEAMNEAIAYSNAAAASTSDADAIVTKLASVDDDG